MKNVPEIISVLKRTYPDAKIALNFEDTWQLLVAVVLSAQCTDVRVNMVTPPL
ncbi:endonuclease III, partial [Candidatus Peregrinibacteria bacterium]|nr:endonuclease III [Candidatus Peregrinibacteria bacterium]